MTLKSVCFIREAITLAGNIRTLWTERKKNDVFLLNTKHYAKTLLLFCSSVNCLYSSSHSTAEPPHRYERDKWEAHWRTKLNINLKLQVLVLPCLWFLSINLLAAVVSVYGSNPAS